MTARRLRGVLLIGLTVFAAVAGWWVAARLDPFASASAPHHTAADQARGELRFDPARDKPDDSWLDMLGQANGSASLTLNPLREPLEGEPAELKPYPGPEEATNETRYRIAEGPWVDEVSFWRVAGNDPAALAAKLKQHYTDMARESGFKQPATNPGTISTNRTRLSYFDTQDNFRALSIQIREQTHGCHVTIWLRYETTTP